MKLNKISESKVPVTDNEIGSLKHHVEDALEALGRGDKSVLDSSLKDIMEIAVSIEKRFSRIEQQEI